MVSGWSADERQVDVVVKIAAERVVGVVAEGPDGRRKRRDEAAENAALFRGGIADLRLVHAVLPNEVGGDVGGFSELQVIAETEAELPFFLIVAQGFQLGLAARRLAAAFGSRPARLRRVAISLSVASCWVLQPVGRCGGCRWARTRRSRASARPLPALAAASRRQQRERAEGEHGTGGSSGGASSVIGEFFRIEGLAHGLAHEGDEHQQADQHGEGGGDQPWS